MTCILHFIDFSITNCRSFLHTSTIDLTQFRWPFTAQRTPANNSVTNVVDRKGMRKTARPEWARSLRWSHHFTWMIAVSFVKYANKLIFKFEYECSMIINWVMCRLVGMPTGTMESHYIWISVYNTGITRGIWQTVIIQALKSNAHS